MGNVDILLVLLTQQYKLELSQFVYLLVTHFKVPLSANENKISSAL